MRVINWKNSLLPFLVVTILTAAVFIPLVMLSGKSNTSQNVQFIIFGFSLLIALLTYVGLIWKPSRKMDKKYNTDSTWEIEAKRDYPHLTLTFQEFKRIKIASDWNIFLIVSSLVVGQIIPLIITALI